MFVIMFIQYLKLVFVLLSIFFFCPSVSDPRTSMAGYSCKKSNVTERANLYHNYMRLTETLNALVLQNQHGTYSVSSPLPKIYGLAQCHGDLLQEECWLCFHKAKDELKSCIPATGGAIHLKGCFLRYELYNFFLESNAKIGDMEKACVVPTSEKVNEQRKLELEDKLDLAVLNATVMALWNGGFGVAELRGGVLSVYVLAQCWKTLNITTCRQCLEDASVAIRKCVPGADGQVLYAGCYLRYSIHKFYNTRRAVALVKAKKEKTHTKAVILITVPSLILALFAALGGCIGYRRYSKGKEGSKKVGPIPFSYATSKLNYKYEILEQATNSFDPSNKLGQGGAGSVFRGLLPDGTMVAVKKLFLNTRQWADEFFNEVNLISGVQHKNLVRLLGCSIEGPESLLVYEFVPNRNLDQILFARTSTQVLSWNRRFNIILGIAEGLAHLHEGLQERIIHRDIKSSNILLDGDLTPKIADFGLARRVASNKTHLDTGVAGTLGYLAPEYLVQGCLTEKADVYAFGVLTIEIACGRKNNVFFHDSGSVLQSVWENYKSGTITKSIDSQLNGDFPKEQASRVLQIGLLCTQTRRSWRPSMSNIVEMLINEGTPVPPAKQPPFQNSSFLSSDNTTRFPDMNSMSSWHSTMDVMSNGSTDFASISSL